MTSALKLPVIKTAIQIRHSDIDSLGHVSNTVYPHYLELARVEFFRAAGQLGACPSTKVTRLNIDITGEIVYGDDIYVKSWCSELDGEHIEISQHIIVNDRVINDRIVTKGIINLIGFDYSSRKTVAFPAEWEISAAAPV